MNGLLQNLTINEIAQHLGFSHSTVRQESIAIYKALQIEGRTAIADRARQLQLFYPLIFTIMPQPHAGQTPDSPIVPSRSLG
jgi:hypothetical protein